MRIRHHVAPPCSAPAPNVAPGREFWTNWEGDDFGQCAPPPFSPVEVDLSRPNNTRVALSSQLYTIYLNAGNDAATAQALADARALAMVP